MTKARKTIATVISFAIFCSLFVVVFAVGNSNMDDLVTPSAANPFEYAKAPDDVYVFLYHGSSPYMSMDIDTSECVVDRLYVYNSTTDSVVEITEQNVTAYTYTINALYYVTEEQKIYKTDYSGSHHELLYQCTQGTVHNLSSFFDTLYFVEDQSRIMLLDVASKTAQQIWECEDLDWVIMLNTSQLIATTVEEENYLCDISANTATLISSIEATNLINAAVKGTASNNARSTTPPNFSVMVTQENDVSFPIPEYNVVNYNNGFAYETPVSWFHINGQEGCNDGDNCKFYGGSCQCEGFAMYVHDVYAHMVDYDITTVDAWESNKCTNKFRAPNGSPSSLEVKVFDGDVREIEEFFALLNTGAYVRYGKDSDTTPDNGCHSIVFIARDDQGIWVYECNQRYDSVNSHGCGVFIQYYTYQALTNYQYIVNYVNHSFDEELADYDATHHKVGCSDCGAYLLQEHTSVSKSYVDVNTHEITFPCCEGDGGTTAHTSVSKSYVDANTHSATFNCCGGNTVATAHTNVSAFYVDANTHSATFDCCGGNTDTTAHTNVGEFIVSLSRHETQYSCCNGSLAPVAHTGSATYTSISSSKHSVRYSCCRGSITAVHMFDYNENNQRECMFCGYVNNNLLSIEDEEID